MRFVMRPQHGLELRVKLRPSRAALGQPRRAVGRRERQRLVKHRLELGPGRSGHASSRGVLGGGDYRGSGVHSSR